VVCILLFPALNVWAVSGYEAAVAYFKKQQWQEVIEEIRKHHEAGQNSYESHALCGFAYSKLGNFESASSHFLQAIKWKPDDPRVRADLIRLHLNHNKLKSGFDLAVSALEKFPEDSEIQFLYATALFLRGKPKTALLRVEKLKAESPDNAELLNLEGKIYYTLGNYEKSELSLKWATVLKRDSPSIWNNLALVQENLYKFYEKSGDTKNAALYKQEAKDSIQKAVSLDARNPSIAINAERILSY